MDWYATKFISAFLLPPLNFLLLGVVGLAISKARPALGRTLVVLMLLLLWIFSLPVTGNHLVRLLENRNTSLAGEKAEAQAIVVLGGDANFAAPEFGGNTVGKETLQRLRYAAVLQRRTGLPILLTGGDPEGRGVAQAVLMKKVLEQEFNVAVRWVEAESGNTLQNAVYSWKILDKEGIKAILLVTNGWHMPRARRLFEQAGFNVVAAGTGFHDVQKLTAIDFLPSVQGLEGSRIFFHEMIGLLWARLASAS